MTLSHLYAAATDAMAARRTMRLSVISLFIVLGSCGAPVAPLPAAHHQAQVFIPVLQSPVHGAECLIRLSQEGVSFRSVVPPTSPHPCGISDPVSVGAAGPSFNRPVLMECGLADALARWQHEVVQPAAIRLLHQEIRATLQVGAYVCRQENGSGRNYTSQHAFGRAIDLSGWVLSDGSTAMVGRDWHSKDGRGAFLQEISRRACSIFSVVLTPEVNAAHHGHIHLDIGPYHFCGKGGG